MVEGLALARLGRDQEANEHLQKADHLCQLKTPRSMASLLRSMVWSNSAEEISPWLTFSFAKACDQLVDRKTNSLKATTLLNLGLLP